MNAVITNHIFRAYDIRGVYGKDINTEIFQAIGCAVGTYLNKELKSKKIAVGCDIRRSSSTLMHSFITGLLSVGCDVVLTGTSSFGQTLFKGWKEHQDLIAFVTASHLPAEWNGVKFYYGDGVGLPEEELMKIRDITLNKFYKKVDWDKLGTIKIDDSADDYIDFFKSRLSYRKKIRVAVDCGGASMTLSAPSLFESMGIEVAKVFCEPDQLFTKRPSDPKPKYLKKLIEVVLKEKCDFGVAFDGDGDRSVIVDETGKVLTADQIGIIIGKHGINPKKGKIIVNVECSKTIKEQLEPIGYKIKQIPVGHTFLTLHVKKEKSPLGIESSGHIVIPEFFLFDDAIVVPLKIAEILDKNTKSLSELVKEIPVYPIKKVEIQCSEDTKFDVVKLLKEELLKEFKNVNLMDGIRVELEKGWVLVRPSNTSPIIRLTIEADNEEFLEELTQLFLGKIECSIQKISPKC